MGTREERGAVREAVRALLLRDRASGTLEGIDHYARLFPGFGEILREEYALAGAATDAAGRPAAATVTVLAPASTDGAAPGSTTAPPAAPGSATPAAPSAPPSGDLGTVGSYRLVAELGAGGMGRVYRAVCGRRAAGVSEGQQVALKVVHAHLTETGGFFKRFLREAEIGKRVHHPNVVRTLDVDAASLEGLMGEFNGGRFRGR